MIKFLDLKNINEPYGKDIENAIKRVVKSGWYILGKEVGAFEREYADYIGVGHTVGVGNGLDALRIILQAYMVMGEMEEGDEVIVPSNTFIASIMAITENRLKPVLVEPDIETYNIDPNQIEKKITGKTKAIMIVHLYGQNAHSQKIGKLCGKYDLKLVEDAAQAHGAYHEEKRIGSLGDAAAFSFYPGKNLGGMGDGGAICTNNFQFAECCRALSNYGGETKYKYKYKGFNSRLDEIQAAILRIKLKGLDADNRKRKEVANFYLQNISNPEVQLPKCKDEASHVWHLFVVRVKNRDEFIRHLKEEGVEASIHYPIAPNEQEGYPELHKCDLPITNQMHKEVVSLPISPVLDEKQLQKVVKAVGSYQTVEVKV
ncbi:DegT/DnrJ/EryC1/StrS family aminotransferase [Rhodohalobacter sp. SW132]|uniref:DegT/DnrJ/EryC1/StrS family aminotransferase n=1 Tax=Rhodohalobacter sp. SW132 TaxID=2293433 RepID=UPI000E2300C8|nr:DegT/DnrJ/EryC1/StrS family aminotransferase [Rhodohalobacter sp. SW132]